MTALSSSFPAGRSKLRKSGSLISASRRIGPFRLVALGGSESGARMRRESGLTGSRDGLIGRSDCVLRNGNNANVDPEMGESTEANLELSKVVSSARGRFHTSPTSPSHQPAATTGATGATGREISHLGSHARCTTQHQPASQPAILSGPYARRPPTATAPDRSEPAKRLFTCTAHHRTPTPQRPHALPAYRRRPYRSTDASLYRYFSLCLSSVLTPEPHDPISP